VNHVQIQNKVFFSIFFFSLAIFSGTKKSLRISHKVINDKHSKKEILRLHKIKAKKKCEERVYLGKIVVYLYKYSISISHFEIEKKYRNKGYGTYFLKIQLKTFKRKNYQSVYIPFL